MSLPLEVEVLILSSALERSKEYAQRAKRKAAAAAIESKIADDDLLRKANELELLRAEWLRRTE